MNHGHRRHHLSPSDDNVQEFGQRKESFGQSISQREAMSRPKEPKLQPKRSLTDIFLRNKSSSGQLSTLNLPKAQSSEEIRSLNTHQARPNEKASPRDDRKKRERFSSTMARFAKVPFSRNRVKTEQRLPAPTQSGERVTPQTPNRKIKVYYDGPENMDISTEERLASPAT